MRPSYTKTNKKKHKKRIRKRNTSSIKTALCGYSRRITSDLEQVLNVHKSKFAQSSWKVMPKDSREVYKIRRKRQIEKKNRDCEGENSTSNKKDTTSGECQSNHKQRDDSSKSSYSNDSASETSCSLTDSDN